jgi:cyclin-dependent kinase-like
MFRGLKRSTEDRARSLYKLFPAWPPLALGFTSQCLRLDPSHRSSSTELIHHLYFTHDHFSDNFLPILRAKIQQEFQGNPLLQKYETAIFVDSSARKAHELGHNDMIDSKGNFFSYKSHLNF